MAGTGRRDGQTITVSIPLNRLLLPLLLILPLVASLLLGTAVAFEGKPKFGPDAVPISRHENYLRAAPAPDYWKLSPFYVPQQTSSACSVASMAMTLNFIRGLPSLADQRLVTQRGLLKKVGDRSGSKRSPNEAAA